MEEQRYIQGEKGPETAHERAEIGLEGQSCTWNVMDMITLHNSPLRELVLKDTGLSAAMWRMLFQALDLPLLQHLEVDHQCLVNMFLKFLQ